MRLPAAAVGTKILLFSVARSPFPSPLHSAQGLCSLEHVPKRSQHPLLRSEPLERGRKVLRATSPRPPDHPTYTLTLAA